MATTSMVPAVAAARQAVVVPNVLLSDTKATQDVLRTVTLYKFEPAEIQKIQSVRLIDLFAEHVHRYTEGMPLLNVVDKQRGY